MIPQNIIKNRKYYYSQTFILYELLNAMRNREVIFMSKRNNKHCIRGLVIQTIDYMKDVFDRYRFFNKDYNIYISVGKYRYIPNFSFDLSIRSSQTREWFREKARTQLYEYDLLLDFDTKQIKDFAKVIDEVKLMTDFLNLSKVKYNIVPSGSGIQIRIPSECFDIKKEFKNNEFNTQILKITRDIKTRFKLKHLDLIGIGAYNKIMKCEYSLVDNSVCMPLKYSDVKKFQYRYIQSNKVLKSHRFDRNYLGFHNDNSQDNTKNLSKFLRKYLLNGNKLK